MTAGSSARPMDAAFRWLPFCNLMGNEHDPETEQNPHPFLAPWLPDLGPVLGKDRPRVVFTRNPAQPQAASQRDIPVCRGQGWAQDTLLGGHCHAPVRVTVLIQVPVFLLISDVDLQHFTIPFFVCFWSSFLLLLLL